MKAKRRADFMFSIVGYLIGMFVLSQGSLAFAPAQGFLHFDRRSFNKRDDVGARKLIQTALYSEKNNDRGLSMAHNMERTNPKNLLTQRSIQSFMFILEQCRDPHTINWLENFIGSDLMVFHGTGGLNLDHFKYWDSFFLELIKRDSETIIVSAKRRGAGTGGWSKNNPHLKPRFVEFEIDIDPVSLASRILSVREQISKEWVDDLDLVKKVGDMIMDSYLKKRYVEREREIDDNENKSDGDYTNSREETGERKGPVFDRSSMISLHNVNAFTDWSQNPLRKGSFDLLLLLATQESIHRTLREFQELGTSEQSTFSWLREFYHERVEFFFDGNQMYGRYDDFIEELLVSSPTFKTEYDGKISMVDPVGVVEKLIRIRGEVAGEWKELIMNTPSDHLALRREFLSRQISTISPIEKKKKDEKINEDGFQ